MSKRTCSGRRDFIKTAAAGAAGIALTTGVQNAFAATRVAAGTAPLNKWPGRIVINFNKNAPTGDVDPTAPQITLVQTMVDDSIKLLTGQTDLGTAWKSIFPATGTNAISLTSKIAIKVPVACNASRATPHWWTVQAITNGLQKMNFGTPTAPSYFPAANITIYDSICGNNLNTCGFNATNFPGLGGIVYYNTAAQFVTYADGAASNDGTIEPYAPALNAANFLINVFSPRGHYDAEFFTLGFKNHYGTYPCVWHDKITDANPAGQTQSPYLRNIACTGPVYNKTVLLMCSGLYGLYEGSGPTGTPQNYNTYSKYMDATSTNTNPTTIMMSTDPISIEMQAIKMMRIQGNALYTEHAGLYTTAAMPSYLKASGGVVVAGGVWQTLLSVANVMDNIGIINENQMTILKIINGTQVGVIDRQSLKAQNTGAFVTASQIHGHNTIFIEYALPESHAGKEVSIEIYNLKGTLETRLTHRVGGVLNHLSWNETNASGSRVGNGAYVVRLVSEGIEASSKFAIAR